MKLNLRYGETLGFQKTFSVDKLKENLTELLKQLYIAEDSGYESVGIRLLEPFYDSNTYKLQIFVMDKRKYILDDAHFIEAE